MKKILSLVSLSVAALLLGGWMLATPQHEINRLNSTLIVADGGQPAPPPPWADGGQPAPPPPWAA